MVIPFNIIAVVCVFTMPNSQHDMIQQMKIGKGELQNTMESSKNNHLFLPND
jgi:hypothetical protein